MNSLTKSSISPFDVRKVSDSNLKASILEKQHTFGYRFLEKNMTFLQRLKYLLWVSFAMFSGRWFTYHLGLFMSNNSNEIYERLIRQWGNVGLISALLLTLSYQVYFTVNDDLFISVLTFVSCCCFLLSIVSSVLLTCGLSTVPRERAIDFAKDVWFYLSLPDISLILGIFAFAIQSIWFGYNAYGVIYLQIAMPFAVVFAGGALVFWAHLVLILDRKDGIWESLKK